jgi:opacity protein-like surface antigen
MRFLAISVSAICLTASVHADEARPIIEKAIKAAGWDTVTGHYLTWHDKGKMDMQGQTMEYEAEWKLDTQSGNHRFDLSTHFSGMDLKMSFALNGDKAMESMQDTQRNVEGKKLETVKDSGHVLRVASLKPLLTSKDDTLTVIKVMNVNGKAMVGVKVETPKCKTVTLSFDQETGLLTKSQTIVLNEANNWKEIVEESYYLDWADAGKGLKTFGTLRVDRGGKKMLESKLTQAKFHDKPSWAPSAFEKLKD